MAKCTSKNKAGQRCGANARHGHDTCVIHGDPRLAAEMIDKAQAALAARTPEQRRRKPRELDILAEKLAERADILMEGLMDLAENATKAVVVSGSRDQPGRVEIVADNDLRLKAINAVLDRVHGRPAQGIKLSGDDGAPPIRVTPERSEERAQRVADILARQGAIPGRHEGRQRREPSQTSDHRPIPD